MADDVAMPRGHRLVLVVLVGLGASRPPVVKADEQGAVVEWKPFVGSDGLALAIPKGWQVKHDKDDTEVTEPVVARPTILFVKRVQRGPEVPDAIVFVDLMIERLSATKVLSRSPTSWEEASARVVSTEEGAARLWQLIARVAYGPGGTKVLTLAMLATFDSRRFEGFGAAQVLENFVASVHEGARNPPADVFAGTWEATSGRVTWDLFKAGAYVGSLGSGWYFRLELQSGGRYRLVRVSSSDGPAFAGYTMETETGSFRAAADLLTLTRSTCGAKSVTKGRGQRERCGAPLAALIVAPGEAEGGIRVYGHQIHREGYGGAGWIDLSRPRD
jgi:hypothetical protein